MGSALTMSMRQLVIEEKTKGKSLLVISEQYHLSYSTLRNLWKRYQVEGAQGLVPHYKSCGPSKPKSNALIYRAALWLKRQHEQWGAPLIRLILQERYPHILVPSARTLQRWFKAKGVYKAKNFFPLSQPLRAAAVHDIWQVDAKEQLQLASKEKACYLTIVDEKSGCLLQAFVFPPLPYQRSRACSHTKGIATEL